MVPVKGHVAAKILFRFRPIWASLVADVAGCLPAGYQESMPKPFAFLLFCLAALTLSCTQEQPKPTHYENAQYGIRISPLTGWAVAEQQSPDCLLSVEVVKSADCRLVVCVSPPRPEILLTQNTFVACENIKLYIEEKLKGIHPECTGGKAGDSFAFDTLYTRRIQSGQAVRAQFVNHLFVPAKGKLVQVMAFTLGDTEEKARKTFEANKDDLFRMMGNMRIR